MEPSQKDLYSILNVPRTATPEQIRSAYRELTKAFLGSNSEGNGASNNSDSSQVEAHPHLKKLTLQDISTAFNVLSNPIKRAEYDAKFNPLVDGGGSSALNPAQSVLAKADQSKKTSNPPNSSKDQLQGIANSSEMNGASPERMGRVNNTEFITNKPAAAFSAGTGLRGPFGITDSHLARSDSHKIKPMKDLLGPIFSGRRKIPPGVMVAIVTGSLSVGIIIALIVRNLIHAP